MKIFYMLSDTPSQPYRATSATIGKLPAFEATTNDDFLIRVLQIIVTQKQRGN